jgi:hypothetical protein
MTGETEKLGEYLPQCRSGHHRSSIILTGPDPGPLLWEAGV